MPLAPPKKNDQIFQLSLTELAFTLVFLLLLLSGWMVLDEKQKGEEIAAKLAQSQKDIESIADAKQIQVDADKALNALKKALAGTAYRPDEVISDLKRCSAKETENQQLQVKISDLDQRLTALVAVRDVLERASGENQSDAAKAEVEAALAFKKAYEEATKSTLRRGDVEKRAKECAEAELKIASLARESQNLRGQVAFVGKQLAAATGSKGFGLPPCWVDESGKVQRLLNVEVTEQGLVVRPGWSPEREDDAKKLPNIDGLIAAGNSQSIATFRTNAQAVFDWSRKQDPECRHYASIAVSATSANASIAGNNAVNDYFYPFGKVSVLRRSQ